MPPIRSTDADTPTRAVALIDPYWLVGQSVEPSESLLHTVQRAAGSGVRVERVYWYLETADAPRALPTLPRVTLRVVAQDDLDDGYELVRAMDSDLRAAVASQAYGAVVVASHDDRLALSVEWAQAHGLMVYACATTVEEPDPRMQRIVDEVVEPRLGTVSREEDQAPPAEEALAVLSGVIRQWQGETEAMEVERVRHFMERRPGLPRPVDSRLLFLARTQLGRELTQAERVVLRRQFRETVVGMQIA